jgi:hypothetical protein
MFGLVFTFFDRGPVCKSYSKDLPDSNVRKYDSMDVLLSLAVLFAPIPLET